MPRANIGAALEARNRADRKDVVFKLLVALPATVLGLGFANVLGLFLWFALWQFGVSIGVWMYLLFFNIFLAAMIAVDIKRHPEESWYVPRYVQSDGSVKGHEFDGLLEHYKGSYGGMPLMTNISDPRNLAERGAAITSGFANLILGGPRSIARALDERRYIARRSLRRTVSAAERFVAWLEPRGVVPESEVRTLLDAHPDQAEGLALARDLEVVTRRRLPVEFHYHVREA